MHAERGIAVVKHLQAKKGTSLKKDLNRGDKVDFSGKGTLWIGNHGYRRTEQKKEAIQFLLDTVLIKGR